MENLNAEQVKKALEWCYEEASCSECLYQKICFESSKWQILKDALALINKQETEYNELYELLQTYKADSEAYRSYSKTLEKENEALKTLLDESFEAQNSMSDKIEKLTEENERVRNRITCQVVIPDEKLEEIKTECLERVELDIKAVEADTVEEYRKRVYRKMEKYTVFGREYIQRIMREVAKEMLEGSNNG